MKVNLFQNLRVLDWLAYKVVATQKEYIMRATGEEEAAVAEVKAALSAEVLGLLHRILGFDKLAVFCHRACILSPQFSWAMAYLLRSAGWWQETQKCFGWLLRKCQDLQVSGAQRSGLLIRSITTFAATVGLSKAFLAPRSTKAVHYGAWFGILCISCHHSQHLHSYLIRHWGWLSPVRDLHCAPCHVKLIYWFESGKIISLIFYINFA